MTVRQLRLVVHASDYEQAVTFFRDALAMPVAESYSGAGGAEVTILDAGRATLELSNTAQIELIDRVEVGRRVAPRFRLALEVEDCELATRDALAAGATSVAPPTRTPWNSLNARLDAPGTIHLTLFEEQPDPGPPDAAAGDPGHGGEPSSPVARRPDDDRSGQQDRTDPPPAR
ncbi:VOC family protein [Plantactinospora sp. WMMB782]|uniref:VOC family protein n=1 Tax=Plantactinospora sp. WMMB782 TaxID=3404121 RepID=UPI003B9627F0